MKKVCTLIGCIILFVSIDFIGSAILKKGLDRYFGLNQNSSVLLLGHSHLMLATDKERLEKELGCLVSKYCREGVDVTSRYMMLQHYLSLPEKDSLKCVFYGVDQYMFNPTGLSDNVYKLFYPFMDEPVISDYIYGQTDVKDYWHHKLIRLSRYNDALINSSLRGWMSDWSNYKLGVVDMDKVRQNMNSSHQLRPIVFDADLCAVFEATLDILVNRNIDVVLINTPIIKEYNEADPASYHKVIEYFQQLEKSSEKIHYWDFNIEFSDHYDLFFDPIHLNRKGQEVITNRIINSARYGNFDSYPVVQ